MKLHSLFVRLCEADQQPKPLVLKEGHILIHPREKDRKLRLRRTDLGKVEQSLNLSQLGLAHAIGHPGEGVFQLRKRPVRLHQ